MSRDQVEHFSEIQQYELNHQLAQSIPLNFCVRNLILVMGETGEKPHQQTLVGMVNPKDAPLIELVEQMLASPVKPVRLNRYEILQGLKTVYGKFDDDAHILDMRTARLDEDKASTPDLVDQILKDALKMKASDIHIECYIGDVDVRFRIDGIMHQSFTHLHPENVDEAIRLFKVLSNLDPTESRIPHDGRFRVTVVHPDNKVSPVDFRISIIPGPTGEDAVLRVLDAGVNLKTLEQLGMDGQMQLDFGRLVQNPEGMVIVTGPTGSGKTTTLYAALNHVNDGTKKIITAEDPIEYYVPKINQKQVTPQMSLAALLKSILRHDPNVILFGEIRDHETGEIALEAAATGHLVLGTLHTSDALGALSRLEGLELDRADIAGGMLGILAQRLVRQICPVCSTAVDITADQHKLLGNLIKDFRPKAGRGCHHCHQTGYKGRVGIYELIVVDNDLQAMIANGISRHQMLEHLREQGFRTLLENGLEKVRLGITSLSEIQRVIPYRQLIALKEELESVSWPETDSH